MSSLLILILVASVYLSSAAIRPSNYQSNRKPIITANTIKNLLKEARDEVIDCFDSVVFAENGAERWAALEEIGRRHQRGFTIISAGLVIATVLGRKSAVTAGKDTLRKLRDEEAKRWGTRLG